MILTKAEETFRHISETTHTQMRFHDFVHVNLRYNEDLEDLWIQFSSNRVGKMMWVVKKQS